MSSDPWQLIPAPPSNSQIGARRVDPSARWDLFWAVDADRNPLLVLEHGKGLVRSRRLPKLRGLHVERLPADSGTRERILIRLVEREQRDIFLRFCRDIVDSTLLARTEEQAVERFLARTWRWHRLLQGGRDSRLGDEEQKGLIGELLVLERHLLPALGAADAVRCWTGPLDSPRDFEISRIEVEAKARGPAVPRVTISSEFQLDSREAETLFLHVTEVAIASEGTPGAITLTDAAKATRSLIAAEDMATVEVFEERLAAVGFDWTHDYSDKLWLISAQSLYEVCDRFPRITPGMFATGVGNVRYSVSLPECERFRVEVAALASAIAEAADAC